MDHKEIKIYLAYSPEDVPFDREALGNFIRQQNDHARSTASPVYFHLIECEDMADLPEETDLVVSLSVHHGGGQKLLEDIWGKEDAPPVITFFRSDSAAAESLKQLQTWLSERKIYWTEYRDPTVIMYKLLMHFSQQGQRAIFCKEDGDGLHVDGSLLLKARDFSFLRDDQNLQQIDSQIARLEAEQNRLYSINQFAAGKQLNPEIDELKKQKRNIILAYFQWLQEDAPVSERQRQARIAAQNHDYSESKRLLSREIVDRDVENRKLKNAIENSISLQEYLSIATNLQMEPQTPEQIIEVRLTLMHAAALEAEHNLGTHARQTQVAYLLEWASAEDAVACASEFVALFDPDEISPDHARAQQLLAKAHLQNGPTAEESFACFEKALNIWNALRNADPDQWFPAWAECCRDCAAAAAAHNRHQYAAARKLLEEATDVFKALPEDTCQKWELLRVELFLALGDLLHEAGDNRSADCQYTVAQGLSMRSDSTAMRLCHAEALMKIGLLFCDNCQNDVGYGFFEDALSTLEQVASRNVLSPAESLRLQNLKFQCHMDLGRSVHVFNPDTACDHFQKALTALAGKPCQHLHDPGQIAALHATWACIVGDSGDIKAAREHWNIANQICGQLEESDFGATVPDRIRAYRMIADGHLCSLNLEEAKNDTDPDSFNNQLRASARTYLRKAVDLHRQLESSDFRPTIETWRLFTVYMSLFHTANKNECRALFNRCRHFLLDGFTTAPFQYVAFLVEYSSLCYHAGKIPEAVPAYEQALRLYRPYVEKDQYYLVSSYAKCAYNYGELLDKKMKRPQNAIEALKSALEFLQSLPETDCQLSGIGRIAHLLVNLYKKQPGCNKWMTYAELFNDCKRKIEALYKNAQRRN